MAYASEFLKQDARAAVAPSDATETGYFLEAEDACCTVFSWQGYIIFAFRGTEPQEFWSDIANIDTTPVPLGGGVLVPAGYWKQTCLLMAAVQPLFLAADPTKIIFTGHSMGGTMAELYASTLPNQDAFQVITFGAPKSGNGAFWRKNVYRAVRIVNEMDFAPAWPWAGYDQPLYAFPWFNNGQISFVTSRPGFIWPGSLADHLPAGYIASFQPLLTSSRSLP